MRNQILKALGASGIFVAAVILFHRLYMAPQKVIKTSISPNSLVKVEFINEGYWGKSSVMLSDNSYRSNALNSFFKPGEIIYSEPGNEIIFPDDVEVIWSKDSSKFLAISRKANNVALKSSRFQDSQLSSGEKLVLMYDIPSEVMWHNLYKNSRNNASNLHLKDVSTVQWMGRQVR